MIRRLLRRLRHPRHRYLLGLDRANGKDYTVVGYWVGGYFYIVKVKM
jgi:hypothetical protein